MSQVHYLVVRDGDEENITVFIAGAEKPYTAHSSHPNYDAIRVGAEDNDESIVDLFDVAETVGKRFTALTDRVSVSSGQVYFDGDRVDNALTQQILRFLNEEVADWFPLVEFMENVATNPNEHSREQLYEWLNRRDFTINNGGELIGYKGVARNGDKLLSVNSGGAIVDGTYVSGRVPNEVGSVIEMPRSEVTHDPAIGCSRGLHVGTYDYAMGWARGALLKVAVNPRDVVSVPTDCDAAKVRVCRYRVLEVIDAPVTSAYDSSEYDEDYDDYGYDDEYANEYGYDIDYL